MQQTTEQRGQPLSDGVRNWGSALATQTLHATSSDGWTFHPLASAASPSPNPWQVQHRASVDGNVNALFWSSVCGGETLTGVIRSPNFVIPDKLSFFIAGHNGNPSSNALPEKCPAIAQPQGNRVLAETLPPRNDRARRSPGICTRSPVNPAIWKASMATPTAALRGWRLAGSIRRSSACPRECCRMNPSFAPQMSRGF